MDVEKQERRYLVLSVSLLVECLGKGLLRTVESSKESLSLEVPETEGGEP